MRRVALAAGVESRSLMDRMLDVRTPESIAFSYELAGVGSRLLAVVIDLVIQILILTLFFVGLSLLAVYAPESHAKSTPEIERFAINLVIGFFIFVVFMIFFGYFIFFEALWNGQTPGKKLLGIRVVRDGGYPIDFSASLVRNLVRVGEFMLSGYVIAGISALVSPENKRIGDFAAGTIVVRDARLAVSTQMLRELASEPTYADTVYCTGEERALIKRFLERRVNLTPNARVALAAQIAGRLRSRLPADLQRLDDESLLERL